MKRKKLLSITGILLAIVFVMGLYSVSVFAQSACKWCRSDECKCSTMNLSQAIGGDFERYEIELVRKTVEGQQPEKRFDGKNLYVTVPVDANENDLIRGIQVDLSSMQNYTLEFYDGAEKIEQFKIIGLNSNVLSRPTYSNKVIIKAKEGMDNKLEKIFKISSIKYNKSAQDKSNRSVDLGISSLNEITHTTELKWFEKELKSIDKDVDIGDIKQLDKAVDFGSVKSDVLYQTMHGYTTGPHFKDAYYLEDMVNLNKSSLDWILLKSCYSVNEGLANLWCDYLMGSYVNTNDKHITKGIFGYPEKMPTAFLPSARKFISDFVIRSQKRPLLDSYLGAAAQISEIREKNGVIPGSIHWNDIYPYSTVIINENNINDSMFEVSETTANSKYRYYTLSKIYDDNEKIDYNTFLKGCEVEIKEKYMKKFIYLKVKYSSVSNIDTIEIGEDKKPEGIDYKEYVINLLNTMSLEEFDKITVCAYLPEYVKKLRNVPGKEIIYKKLVLFYRFQRMNSNKTLIYYAVNRPKVEVEKINGYYVAEYAELQKVNGKYVFITDPKTKEIVWKKDILYSYKKKVPWYTDIMDFINPIGGGDK